MIWKGDGKWGWCMVDGDAAGEEGGEVEEGGCGSQRGSKTRVLLKGEVGY